MMTPMQLKDISVSNHWTTESERPSLSRKSVLMPTTLESWVATRAEYSHTEQKRPINLAGKGTGDDDLVYTDELVRFHEHACLFG